ncbi:MAG TPA: cyclic nucleotide-binding domain-containing protein, partial [Thermoanaerobaculia bacterium]|nr:cyclic nucleotide-binding domain-containing protein [Thermoanaerobaculia bacterium]
MRATQLFAGIPAEALAELSALCTPRCLDSGEYLFHAGAPADNLYVVAAGGLEVVRLAGDHELLLNVLGPGRVVGELAILRGEPRSASVRAGMPTILYAVEGQAFLAFVHAWPQAAVAVARQVAENLVRTENKVRPATERPLWAIVTDSLPADFALQVARAALPYLAAAGRRVVVLSERGEHADLVANGARLQLRRLDEANGSESHAETALVVAAGSLAALGGIVRRATGIVHGPGVAVPTAGDRVRNIEVASSGAPS